MGTQTSTPTDAAKWQSAGYDEYTFSSTKITRRMKDANLLGGEQFRS